jgi:hypothetical protein
MGIAIRRLHPGFAGEISDIDPNRPISPEDLSNLDQNGAIISGEDHCKPGNRVQHRIRRSAGRLGRTRRVELAMRGEPRWLETRPSSNKPKPPDCLT